MRRTAPRIIKRAALGMALAAVAAPAASAQPVDIGPQPVPPVTSNQSSPIVRTVESGGGFDWGDAGIGAGGVLGVVLLGAGGAFAVSHRRTSHAGGGRSAPLAS